MAAVHACRPLSGFCYTQLTDTFLEKNGLLTEDRVPKAPVEALAKATRGPDAHLQDWHLDPLGHARRWLARRGPDFPIEWTRVGEIAEVIAYPGERQGAAAGADGSGSNGGGSNGGGSDNPAPDHPPATPPSRPGGFERRSRAPAGGRPRRKAA
jgi:hypothetical protein